MGDFYVLINQIFTKEISISFTLFPYILETWLWYEGLNRGGTSD